MQLINEEKNKVIAARLSEKENSATLESEIVRLKSELDGQIIILDEKKDEEKNDAPVVVKAKKTLTQKLAEKEVSNKL